MTDGFVYFASATFADGERIKVGYSTAPWARVAELCPRAIPVDLVCYVPGCMADEQAIHHLLEKYRTDRNEWFRPCRRLSRLITYCKENGELPEHIAATGSAWLALRDAKRRFNEAASDAGNYFSNRNRFGIEWVDRK